jgi:transposase, IS30 family
MEKKYTHFTGKDRENLYIWKKEGITVNEIAKRLGKDRSSIFRELSRNSDRKIGYLPDRAHDRSLKRRASRVKKLNKNPKLKSYVIAKLRDGWSPEMISGRAKYEGFPFVASSETIYQFVYSAEGNKLGLFKCLRTKRATRGKLQNRKPRGVIFDRISIHDRPAVIEDRREFGHYEGDLVINKTSMSRNISIVLERKTRFVRLNKNESKKSTNVIQKIFNTIAPLPASARRSITFDNGKEFAKHSVLRVMKTETYFCDAYASWQKGGVENVNRIIRWFLPKSMPLKDLTKEQLDRLETKINNLPRKCLGFRSAAEAFGAEIVALQT